MPNQINRLFTLGIVLPVIIVLAGCRSNTNSLAPNSLNVFGQYHVRSLSATLQCLSIHSDEQQARLQLMRCRVPTFGTDHQLISLEQVEPGIYAIHWVNHGGGSGYCLGNASAGPEAPLEQNPCTGSRNQQWEFRRFGEGYEIKNRDTQLCMDDFQDFANDGARVNQDNCNNANKQRWAFIAMNNSPDPIPINTPPPTPPPAPTTKRICINTPVDPGWIITDFQKEGPPENCRPDKGFKVWVLERFADRPLNTVIDACKGPVPEQTMWKQEDETFIKERCGFKPPQPQKPNTMRIRRFK